MPLLKGSATFTRYRLDGPAPDMDRIRLGLEEYAFREPLSAAKKGETFGWCSVHNLCDAPTDVVFSQYVVFSLRTDVKRLPAALFKAMLEKEYQRWMAGTGRERVPAAVKKELREQLELDLLPRQLPSVSAVDVYWDTGRGEVLFFSTSAKACDRFRKLFTRAFGVEILPVGPVRAGMEGIADVRAAVAGLDRAGVSMLFGGEEAGGPLEVGSLEMGPLEGGSLEALDLEEHPANRFLGREFLAYLWHQAEEGFGHVDLPVGPVDFWIDDRLVMRAPGEDAQTVGFKGGAPANAREARMALGQGKAPEEARLGLRVGEREYTFTLKGGAFTVSGLKLPQVVKKGDVEAVLYERAYLLDEAQAALGGLLGQFMALRLSPGWTAVRARIRDWMGVDDGWTVSLSRGDDEVTLGGPLAFDVEAAN